MSIQSQQISLETIRGRTVLLKVAYDLPSLEDTNRIESTLETLHYLLERNNRVLIATHWGRPDDFDPSLSTELLAPVVSRLYKKIYNTKVEAQYLNQFDYFETGNVMRLKRVLNVFKSQVILLENTRFDPRETIQNKKQSQELSTCYESIVDAVVDEAFALSHRQEVTNYDIKSSKQWAFGLNYQKEVQALNKLSSPTKPYLLILGGAKLETKIPLLKHLLPKVDNVLIGGQAAMSFLGISGGVDLKNSNVDTNFDVVIKEMIAKYNSKIVLPVDLVFNQENQAMDIGPKTIELFESKILESNTLFWNGPLGKYEEEEFLTGSKQIAATIAKHGTCYRVIGGGDTACLITPARREKINHLSTGGGATLDYLSKL
jgi:3-phosphoglycerate kinase